MIGLLGSLLGIVPAVERIGSKIADAQVAKANALTDRDKIAADERVKTLEMQRDVLIAEQGSWMTRWVRPLLALGPVVYLNKIFLWDKVLKLGTTDPLSDELSWVLVAVVTAFLLSRPVEKIGQTIAVRRK